MNDHAHGAEPVECRDGDSVSDSAQAQAVQIMFNSIAPRYDLLNHVLSGNIDRLWWWRTARRFRHILQQPEAQIVDMCCGTGDMTLALLRFRPGHGRPIVALDFAKAMLERAKEKFSSAEFATRRAIALEADAMHMPIADNSVDLITSAFGFRNLSNYNSGLKEMHRVLRSGGELGILDFSEPNGAIGRLYQLYFRHILPRIGKALSGSAASYEYLPRSVHRFPAPKEMLAMLETNGFHEASWTSYTFGIAGLYRAVKA